MLRNRFGERVRFDEPLSRHTSFRIGGPADVWIECEHTADIQAAQELSRESGLPLYVLGGGTNVLVSDRGVRGIVLRLGRPFAVLRWTTIGSGERAIAGAAVPFKKLVTQSIERDLTGLEFAEGIPGTLGGGLRMNAGAFGSEISDVLSAITGIDPEGRERRVPRSHLRFSYRRFDLDPGFIVTGLEFDLQRGVRTTIQDRRDEAKRRREMHQPRGYPNAGSVFKNPPGHFAGRLIEAVGCKGRRYGDAMFSERHANFIVNLGAARAADVRFLMNEAAQKVWEHFGVRIEPEVRLVGEWEDA
jgi:UDP-N-acetylmuramate dehydrogenase